MLQTTDPQLFATESKELRCVAPPYRGCNTLLLAQRDPLLDAAMRACAHWGDSEAARQEMRRQIAEVPHEHRAELLAHFLSAYPEGANP